MKRKLTWTKIYAHYNISHATVIYARFRDASTLTSVFFCTNWVKINILHIAIVKLINHMEKTVAKKSYENANFIFLTLLKTSSKAPKL